MNILFLQNLGINESLSLTELSAFLQQDGHCCDLLIERNEPHFYSKIEEYQPELVIIPWDIGVKDWVVTVVRNLKQKIPGCPVLFCGTYPSFYPDRSLSFPEIDTIIIGEVEYAVKEYIEAMQGKRSKEGIKNLWFKERDQIIRNEFRPLIADLDSLPLPDREIYFKYPYLRNMSFKRFTSGKGCGNSCRFCYNPLFRKRLRGLGRYVRRKSVSRLIEEIKDVQSRSALKTLHFSDDIFLIDKEWLREFSRTYKKEVNIPFTCNSTAESINEEVVGLLKEANCTGIAIGIESGNEDFRKFILNKDFTNEDLIRAAKIIKSYGLFLTTFNMLAMPGEEVEDVFRTIELNAQIKTDHVRLSFMAPFPGTEIAEYGLKKGLFSQELVDSLLDTTIYPKNSMIKSEDNRIFENLFILFRFGVRFPSLLPLIRRFQRSPVVKIFSFGNFIMNSLGERRFFNIQWIPGIIYMHNSGTIRERTKVFNNFMP